MTTIERLRELERAASRAPWYTDPNNHKEIVRAPGGGGVLCGSYHDANVGTANVDLAAATRNALPAMLAVIEAAEAMIEDAKTNKYGTAPMSPLIAALAAFREVR